MSTEFVFLIGSLKSRFFSRVDDQCEYHNKPLILA